MKRVYHQDKSRRKRKQSVKKSIIERQIANKVNQQQDTFKNNTAINSYRTDSLLQEKDDESNDMNDDENQETRD